LLVQPPYEPSYGYGDTEHLENEEYPSLENCGEGILEVIQCRAREGGRREDFTPNKKAVEESGEGVQINNVEG